MKQFFIKYKQIQKQHNLASTAGFTLVELLVSIALLSIMAGIGISIYAVINSSYDQSQALSLMQTQGSQVLEVIERSIRGSNRAEVISDSNCAEDLCLVIGVPSIVILPLTVAYDTFIDGPADTNSMPGGRIRVLILVLDGMVQI